MKLSEIISPTMFRRLATYITICDEKLGLTDTGTEVQDDLLKFADALEKMEAAETKLEEKSSPCLREKEELGECIYGCKFPLRCKRHE